MTKKNEKNAGSDRNQPWPNMATWEERSELPKLANKVGARLTFSKRLELKWYSFIKEWRDLNSSSVYASDENYDDLLDVKSGDKTHTWRQTFRLFRTMYWISKGKKKGQHDAVTNWSQALKNRADEFV